MIAAIGTAAIALAVLLLIIGGGWLITYALHCRRATNADLRVDTWPTPDEDRRASVMAELSDRRPMYARERVRSNGRRIEDLDPL